MLSWMPGVSSRYLSFGLRPVRSPVEQHRAPLAAANGALCCSTGERTGRSPKDKYLEDTPGIHDNIDWGSVNRPISSEHFAALEDKARAHLDSRPELYRFDGYCGADERHRLASR